MVTTKTRFQEVNISKMYIVYSSMSYIIYANLKISLFFYAMNNIRRFHLHLQ
jgi:hypothetical protein